jgi:uncharacterized protein with HEPN domain
MTSPARCTFGRSSASEQPTLGVLLALVKDIEIVGEAANRVSAPARSEWVEIPWQDIVAMRHRLIHGYFDIDLDVVWSTVTQDLPSLAAQIEAALRSAE